MPCQERDTCSTAIRTTASRPITAGSKRGYHRCAGSRPSGHYASSPPDTPSCRTYAAGTTSTPSVSVLTTASASHPPNSPTAYRPCSDRDPVTGRLRPFNATAPSVVGGVAAALAADGVRCVG